MADTWMLPERKKEMLSYIEEGAGLEDLKAAGYSDREIQEINADSEVLPFEETGDTLQPYTPTRRENFSRNVQEGLKSLGLPEGVARHTASGVAGTSSNTGNMGLADFTPLGIMFGVEEGVGQVSRGYKSGNKTDVAMGAINTALNVASAIPGVRAVAKGVSKLSEKAVEAYDPAVVSAFGASHKTPRYLPEDLFEQDPLAGGGNSGATSISFRDPLIEIFNEMEIPEKGLKGSQLIKDLQDNPTARNAQLKSQDIFSNIDPQRRYTKEEIGQILASNAYDVQAHPERRYESYQRQFDLIDAEVPESYIEYSIEATPTSPEQKTFYPEREHYSANTLAHVRLSERESSSGNYVLVEELQSDLLQGGFINPAQSWEEMRDSYIKRMDDPVQAHLASKIRKEDIKDYLDGGNLDSIIEEVLYRGGFNASDRNNRYAAESTLLEIAEAAPLEVLNAAFPPVAKTEETVRLGVETAIAHAANSGLTRVVIPPFDEIVAKRFSVGSRSYKEALNPKSGFYATYVKGLEKVLKDLKAEYKDQIEIGPIDLGYDLNKREDDIVPFGEVDEDFKPEPTPKKISVKQGTQIDFRGLINSGYDLARPKFAKGGMVEQPTMDPVSKNPVPPGATPKEVRDDVPIMASEGEYVIPANVVRFIGLDKIEKMVSQAKEKLKELDDKGRIGGQSDDDLPFSAGELQLVDDTEMPKMATGGLIQTPSSKSNTDVDPLTGLPLWMLNQEQAVQAPRVTSPSYESGRDKGPYQPATGLAGSVDNWTVDDFTKYGQTRNSIGQGAGQMLASFVPFGGIAAKARERYLEKTVPERIEEMLSTGKDREGKTLSQEQLASLKTTQEQMANTPLTRGGIGKVARGIGEDLGIVNPREQAPQRPSGGFIDRALDFVTGKRQPSESSSGKTGIISPRDNQRQKSKSSGGSGQEKSYTSKPSSKTGTSSGKKK